MAIPYIKIEIVDYDYYTQNYELPITSNPLEQQNNINKWIDQATRDVDTYCAGFVYSYYPQLKEKYKNGTITALETQSAVKLQNAICSIVETYIQNGHFFTEMNGNLSGSMNFSLNAKYENASIENQRQDIIRELVSGGWTNKIVTFDINGNPSDNKVGETTDISKLQEYFDKVYLKLNATNSPDSAALNFDWTGNNIFNISKLSGTLSNTAYLENFTIRNCVLEDYASDKAIKILSKNGEYFNLWLTPEIENLQLNDAKILEEVKKIKDIKSLITESDEDKSIDFESLADLQKPDNTKYNILTKEYADKHYSTSDIPDPLTLDTLTVRNLLGTKIIGPDVYVYIYMGGETTDTKTRLVYLSGSQSYEVNNNVLLTNGTDVQSLLVNPNGYIANAENSAFVPNYKVLMVRERMTGMNYTGIYAAGDSAWLALLKNLCNGKIWSSFQTKDDMKHRTLSFVILRRKRNRSKNKDGFVNRNTKWVICGEVPTAEMGNRMWKNINYEIMKNEGPIIFDKGVMKPPWTFYSEESVYTSTKAYKMIVTAKELTQYFYGFNTEVINEKLTSCVVYGTHRRKAPNTKFKKSGTEWDQLQNSDCNCQVEFAIGLAFYSPYRPKNFNRTYYYDEKNPIDENYNRFGKFTNMFDTNAWNIIGGSIQEFVMRLDTKYLKDNPETTWETLITKGGLILYPK